MNFNLARSNMVRQQIHAANVSNTRVLDVMATLPREQFVLELYQKLAFSDAFIPMNHNQVMLPPNIIGRILQFVNINEHDTVLEIGTGTGYLTCLLAQLAKEVVSIEIFPDLKDFAERALKAFSIDNTEIILGNGLSKTYRYQTSVLPDQALFSNQFDVIILTGSLTALPEHFKQCLKNNGRLFAFIGQWPVLSAYLITRKNGEEWLTQSLFETYIPPLINTHQQKSFHFEVR